MTESVAGAERSGIVAPAFMLSSLEIKNFKCFRELKVEPLAKVNIFVGAGNSGKTSLLEAMCWLPHSTPNRGFEVAGLFRDASLGREFNKGFDRWLFNDLNSSKDVSLRARLVGNALISEIVTLVGKPRDNLPHFQHVENSAEGHAVYWAPPPENDLPIMRAVNTDRLKAQQLALDYDRWTKRPENDDRFLGILKAVDPRLKSLRPMDPEGNGMRMVYADVRLPERIPLPMLGEGFNRLVQIVGAIIGEGAEIVLVDEIENGLHWKALPQVWTGLKAAVSSCNAQIFATTHSYECIKAAIEVFRGEPRGELAVHRLERRDDGEIQCVTIEEEMLEQAMDENWEIR